MRVLRLVPGHGAIAALAMAPIAVPGIVMGVGLFLVYSRPPFLLYGTLWILLIGFITIEMPAGYQQVQAALRGLHVELHLRRHAADRAAPDHRAAAA